MRPPYGANCLVTIGVCPMQLWKVLNRLRAHGLRSWMGRFLCVAGGQSLRLTSSDDELKSSINRIYIVLPEVFGVNAWVRAWRIAWPPGGIRPWRCRCSPARLLIWSWATTPLIWLKDAARGTPPPASRSLRMSPPQSSWFRARYPQAAIHVVGFCFGGHAAFLAATLPEVEHAFDFYGAGVSRMRPGGGEPSLACCRRSRRGSPACLARLIPLSPPRIAKPSGAP